MKPEMYTERPSSVQMFGSTIPMLQPLLTQFTVIFDKYNKISLFPKTHFVNNLHAYDYQLFPLFSKVIYFILEPLKFACFTQWTLILVKVLARRPFIYFLTMLLFYQEK